MLVGRRADPPGATEAQRQWLLYQGVTDVLTLFRWNICGCTDCASEIAAAQQGPRGFLRLIRMCALDGERPVGPRPTANARRAKRREAERIGKGLPPARPPGPCGDRNAGERARQLFTLAARVVPELADLDRSFDTLWPRLERFVASDEGQAALVEIRRGLLAGIRCWNVLASLDQRSGAVAEAFVADIAMLGRAFRTALRVLRHLSDPSADLTLNASASEAPPPMDDGRDDRTPGQDLGPRVGGPSAAE
jgi:hypothetical protein